MKSFFASLTTAFLAGTMFLGFGATLGAQDASQQPEEIPAQYPGQSQQAPNDSAAGRVSFIHGDLSTQHSDSSEWVAATINTPIVYGDRISTGKRSRAEVQLDHANVLRMSDESTANVVSLSRTQIQLQIGQGLVNYDVLRNSEANVEIETPNVAIRPQMREGSYRITVNSDGETIVDVREGSAEISTPQGSTRVDRGQRITIQGNADNAQYNVSTVNRKDDWTSGMTIATTSSSAPRVGATQILITRVPMILTTMDTGEMYPTTEASGFPKVAPTGHRTEMAAGCMSPTMDGRGFPMSLGAGRHITTVAGSFMEETGAGGRDLCTADTIRSGRLRTFPSSVLAGEAGASELASALGGGFGNIGCGRGVRHGQVSKG